MRSQKRFLYMVILTACVFPQWLWAEMASTLELRGEKEPALVGIDVNNLDVKVAGNVDSVAYEELLQRIESLTRNDIRTACAGMSMPSSTRQRVYSGDKPLLRVNVSIVDFDANQSICFVQTCLTRTVCLAKDCSQSFKAIVWETPPLVKMLGRSSLRKGLEKIVSDQAKSFSHSYIMSNPRKLPGADVVSRKQTARRISNTATKQTDQAQPAFVASKNSKVFHKPDCPFAQRIAPKNLVTFSSREEAIAAGKRPCKSCKP